MKVNLALLQITVSLCGQWNYHGSQYLPLSTMERIILGAILITFDQDYNYPSVLNQNLAFIYGKILVDSLQGIKVRKVSLVLFPFHGLSSKVFDV